MSAEAQALNRLADVVQEGLADIAEALQAGLTDVANAAGHVCEDGWGEACGPTPDHH